MEGEDVLSCEYEGADFVRGDCGIRVKFVGREEYVRHYVGRAGMRQLLSGEVLLLMLPWNGVSV